MNYLVTVALPILSDGLFPSEEESPMTTTATDQTRPTGFSIDWTEEVIALKKQRDELKDAKHQLKKNHKAEVAKIRVALRINREARKLAKDNFRRLSQDGQVRQMEKH